MRRLVYLLLTLALLCPLPADARRRFVPKIQQTPPENTVLPAITGTQSIGDTLTVSNGTWLNTPTSYTYQWKRDGSNIGGATANTYVIASVSGGLSCYVTATNAAGSSTVRAESGEPRKYFICGDSLSAVVGYTAAVQGALDTEFGADTFIVSNASHSGDNIAAMEAIAASAVDPNVEVGWSLVFFHEYANQISGINGGSTGTATADLLYDFGEARATAGGLPIYCTSPYNGAQTGGHNGDEAHIASELIRSNYGAHDGVALVDFDDATLLAAINGNDGVHWTTSELTLIAAKHVNALLAAGLSGGRGDIEISVPDFTHLRTYANPAYVYDPVNPLPYPRTAMYLHVLSGTGWDVGSFLISGEIVGFPTDDGDQTLYSTTVSQSTGGLSNGTYELNNTP